MDAFSLMCAPITNFSIGIGGIRATTGTVSSSGWAGNVSGGNPYNLSCPAGYVMTGAYGTFTGSTNAIMINCSKIAGNGTALDGGAAPHEGLVTQSVARLERQSQGFGPVGPTVDGTQLRCQ
jgi:hypothetical protein